MEITDKNRIKALKWFNKVNPTERLELSIKHYNKLNGLTVDEIVFIWRRTTGGEWANLINKSL